MDATEQIIKQVFDIVKGYGHSVALYTEDGKKTVSMAETRRFYLKEIKAVINLSVNENGSQLVINLSKSTDVEDIRPMLDNLKRLANRYIINYVLRTMGKTLEPKDFAFMTRQTNEEFSGWKTSVSTRVNRLGDSRLIVHLNEGDEKTTITKIVIEDAVGEKYDFPSANANAAKAMLRHVHEGGHVKDKFGKSILESALEIRHLGRLKKEDKFFEKASIYDDIQNRIKKLTAVLQEASTKQGYQYHKKRFVNESITSFQKTDLLQSFDKRESAALPYVARILEESNYRNYLESEIQNMADFIMDNKANLELFKPLDNNDPLSPAMRNFKDASTAISAWIQYLVPYIKNDRLANMLMQAGDSVFELGPKSQKKVAAIIQYIRKNAYVKESVSRPVDDMAARDIERLMETNDRHLNDAYNEGLADWKQGLDISDCPYRPRDDRDQLTLELFDAWSEGWHDAEEGRVKYNGT